LADDLEAMGPTYVRRSGRCLQPPDLLPKAYLEALARLQDNVKPFAWEEVSASSNRAGSAPVQGVLALRSRAARRRFSGQVHGAALRDGREVVVKVQRPESSETVTNDFGCPRRSRAGAKRTRGRPQAPAAGDSRGCD
jgi:predicted unusual protein kinase regulating ubiquinone biosynthesis (AarF/ABC1/UbiB family)